MEYKHLVMDTDPVAVLRLSSGKVNAIGLLLVEELALALKDLAGNPSVGAVVLTGGDSRFFSYGFDVGQLLKLDRQQLGHFFAHFCRLVRNLYEFPKPVVAAVNGHAMAGGLILAAAADVRIGAETDYSWGLPEVQLGLAVPYSAVRMMRRRWGEPVARRLCLEGGTYPSSEARKWGVVDETAPPERLLERARAKAQELAGLPPTAYALGKRYLNAGTHDGDPDAEKAENARWLDAWFTPEARERLTRLVNRA